MAGAAKSMLSVLAPSRASSLPQGICVVHKIGIHHKTPVGASLLAMADWQAPLSAAYTPTASAAGFSTTAARPSRPADR
ncbi:hypothetical protein EAH72_18860 [Pseudomonas caspiana]|uniref:Uncharacterized protein n=1 Tax=Pseudomonas mandelii TaxID=75612 RepID=A0A502I8H4_9PSED|nr:hypothetical protein EAH74_17280 [Pseudomonas mandelii]TPG93952.1 hypothetical protein EAH72_18860 [Pseudomonas caspiana]